MTATEYASGGYTQIKWLNYQSSLNSIRLDSNESALKLIREQKLYKNTEKDKLINNKKKWNIIYSKYLRSMNLLVQEHVS